jgi:predicted DNA-binding protein
MKDTARLTIDMNPEDHMYLKLASAKIGITMRELVLTATFKVLLDLEDQWLADEAAKTLERIQSGKEKTIPWKKVKRAK